MRAAPTFRKGLIVTAAMLALAACGGDNDDLDRPGRHHLIVIVGNSDSAKT